MLALVGCSGDEEPPTKSGIAAEWFDALDTAVEQAGQVGPIPKLEQGECPIGPPQIAGVAADGESVVGVSAADSSKRRLICQWSGPVTELVVERFEDLSDLESARQEVSVTGEQDLGVTVQSTETITVGEREFVVRRAVYPSDDSHIDYSVWFFDEEGSGMAILDVETTQARQLITTYTAQQAAEDLEQLLP